MWVQQFVDELRRVVKEHNLRLAERPLRFVCSEHFCILRDSDGMKALRIAWGNPGAHQIAAGDAGVAGEIVWRELDRWQPADASHVVSEVSERIMSATEAAQVFTARFNEPDGSQPGSGN